MRQVPPAPGSLGQSGSAVMPALQKIRSGLVELRSSQGPLYVSPSFWQRIYLLWIFRNFHRLPMQVLDRRQQQLIEKLGRTALVARQGPIARSSLIGSVENFRTAASAPSAMPSAGKVVEMRTSPASIPQAVGSEGVRPGRGGGITSAVARFPDRDRKGGNIAESRSKSISQSHNTKPKMAGSLLANAGLVFGRHLRGALIMVCCVTAACVLFYTSREFKTAFFSNSSPPAIESKAPSSPAPAGNRTEHTTPSAPMPTGETKKVALRPSSAASSLEILQNRHSGHAVSTPPAPLSSSTQRPRVTGWPKSGFSYPIAPSAGMTGKVVLKAVIGTEGSVTSVEVLSGDPLLARAAAGAVRHWQYAPTKVNAKAVETETNIVINFLGDDAVSVSVPESN